MVSVDTITPPAKLTELGAAMLERQRAKEYRSNYEVRIKPLPGNDRWSVAILTPTPEQFIGTKAEGPTVYAEDVVHSDGTYAYLTPGTPVRHLRHPDLTGRIKCLEYSGHGKVSGIPYNVAWDDSDRASDLLGWFWIYATDSSVEAIT